MAVDDGSNEDRGEALRRGQTILASAGGGAAWCRTFVGD